METWTCNHCKEWSDVEELEINNGYCEKCAEDLEK